MWNAILLLYYGTTDITMFLTGTLFIFEDESVIKFGVPLVVTSVINFTPKSRIYLFNVIGH
tara:strand:+ start:312 stop:494 length:183 start_codon:yes stop_codon:yes gene_type:complete